MPKGVISVECLDAPLRAAILKSLQARWSLSTADTERGHQPLGPLLHRLRALARCEPCLLWTGSWALAPPPTPPMSDLFDDLARELVAELGLQGARHLMVVVSTDVHEAFDHALGTDDVRDLDDFERAAAVLECSTRSPLTVQIARLQAPPHACDNPVALARVLTSVHQAVERWTSEA